MYQPLVSIIIPTYNRVHLISETLDSILAQTYTNWECIVVDDGSTDNTQEVVEEYVRKDNRFQYHKRSNSHKSGGNGARNYGFKLSKGKYINWFDSDDVMHPEKLEKQVKGLFNSTVNFSVCQTLVFEGNLKNILGLRHEKIVSEKVLLSFITHKIAFLTQAPVFKRDFLEMYQLSFDEELKAAQEWEFICRVLFFSPNYLADDSPLVYIRKHQDSITYSSNKELREWNYYIAREKVFHFLRSKNFTAKNEIMEYFKSYFIGVVKKYISRKEHSRFLRVYFKSLKYFYKLNSKLIIVPFLFFVFITGKGYRFNKVIFK